MLDRRDSLIRRAFGNRRPEGMAARRINLGPSYKVNQGQSKSTASQTPDQIRQQTDLDERVWIYYHIVPEANYAGKFYARMLSRLSTFPCLIDEDDPDAEPVPVTRGMIDPKTRTVNEDGTIDMESGTPLADADTVLDTWAQVQDDGGGRGQIQWNYGLTMFVSGDGYLVGWWEASPYSTPQDSQIIEHWEFLSNREIKFGEKVVDNQRVKTVVRQRFRQEKKAGTEVMTQVADPSNPQPGECIVFRMWKQDPEYSGEPDGSLRAMADLCEELLLLSADVRETARSRIAQGGILLLSGDISDPVDESDDESLAVDDDMLDDPVFRKITEQINAKVAGNTSPHVPIMMRVEGDIDKMARWVQTAPIQDYSGSERRTETVQRMAEGLDMPPEQLLGVGESNHWSAWAISKEAWLSHGQPVAETMCRDFTSSFFRPALQNAGVTESRRYVIYYSADKVVGNPDMSKDAILVHRAGAISDRALRDATGFDDRDMVTDGSPNSNPLVVTAQNKGAITEDTGGGTGADGDTGTYDTTESEPQDGETSVKRMVGKAHVAVNGNGHAPNPHSDIRAAAAVGLERCREVAGSRISRQLQKDAARSAEMRSVRKNVLAAKLGKPYVEQHLHCEDSETLVSGSTAPLAEALKRMQLPVGMVGTICTMVEQHAADTLYDEDPAPLPDELYWS